MVDPGLPSCDCMFAYNKTCPHADPCAEVPGYTVVPNRDHEYDDLQCDVTDPATDCLARPDCLGFSLTGIYSSDSRGCVKTSGVENKVALGTCLYQKKGK